MFLHVSGSSNVILKLSIGKVVCIMIMVYFIVVYHYVLTINLIKVITSCMFSTLGSLVEEIATCFKKFVSWIFALLITASVLKEKHSLHILTLIGLHNVYEDGESIQLDPRYK